MARGGNPLGDYEFLKYEKDDHVVVLTYNRPDQRNAISHAMNLELHDAWQRFRDDEDAFVLVITGAGSAFSPAGTSRTRRRSNAPSGTRTASTSTTSRARAATRDGSTSSSR